MKKLNKKEGKNKERIERSKMNKMPSCVCMTGCDFPGQQLGDGFLNLMNQVNLQEGQLKLI